MDDQATPTVLNLHRLLAAGGSGAIQSLETTDLDINLVRFTKGGGVQAHVNNEVDVLLVVIEGSGLVTVDGVEHRVEAWSAMLVPKGLRRAIQSDSDGALGYLSVHRRRARLWPQPRPSR